MTCIFRSAVLGLSCLEMISFLKNNNQSMSFHFWALENNTY